MAVGCCPKTFTGFCLDDNTPIAITIDNGVIISWTNIVTGTITPGNPPAGTGVCASSVVEIAPLTCDKDAVTVCQGTTPWEVTGTLVIDPPNLDCLTDSVTICPGANPIPVTFDGTISVSLDCATDSVTICPGDDPIIVTGTVELGAGTLTALETITVNQGTSPWVVSGTVAAAQSGVWTTGRTWDLNFATDQVDASGSVVALDAATLAALESITVQNGAGAAAVNIQDGGNSITVDGAVSVSGTVTADTNFDYPEDSPHVSGDPGAFVLAVRNDAGTPLAADGDYIPFTTDATGALRVNASFTGDISVSLDCATDSVTICPGADPIVVEGTVELGATTLAALETITVLQGTSPWVIGDGGGSITVDGTVAATQSGAWTTGRTWTLDFATDQVDASGSVVALDAPTLAALETITVLQGTSPWVVSGTVTADTNFDYPEDSLHISGDPGAFVLAVRNDLGLPLAGNGDYIPLTTDATGALRTSGIISIGGTVVIASDHAEDFPHVSGDIGNFSLGVRNDAAATLTSTDGDYSPLATDAAGRVGISDLGGSITVDGTVELGATTLAALETITVLQGTSPWVISGTVDTELPAASLMADNVANPTVPAVASFGMLFDGTTWDRVISGSTAADAVGTSATGYQSTISSLRAFNGTSWDRVRSVGNNSDAVAVTTLGILAVDGYNEVFNGTTWDRMRSGTATGSVLVNNPTAANLLTTVGNGAGAAAVNIQDGGNSITVDGTVAISGTVAVTQSTSPWVVSGTVTADSNFDYAEDVPHVSGDIGAFVLAVRNDANAAFTNTNGDYSPIAVNANGAVAISDGGNSITVDGTVAVSGTVAVTQSTSPWVVSGTVTANQGTSPWVTSLDAASLAALESITVQNPGGAGAVNIQDGGNSITVDGTVTVLQGTSPWVVSGSITSVGTKTFTDAYANPTDNIDTISLTAGFNGTTWDRARSTGDNADGVAVSTLGELITISRNTVFNGTTWDRVRSGTATGSVLVNNPTAGNLLATVTIDAGSLAALESITVQNPAGAGAVNIQDGGNSITVDGAVSVTQGTSPWVVQAGAEKAEDSGHTSGQVGNFVLAVRNDAGTSLVDTTLDYAPLQVNAVGELRVTTAAGAAPTGRDDTDNQAPVATGLNTNVVRNYVYDVGGGNWDRWTGAVTVSGTVAVTQSTSPWVTSLDAATLAALESITVQNGAGAAAVNIQDGGNSITVDGAVTVSGTVATNSERAEDSGHTSGQVGNFVLAVRNDTAAVLTSTDLDYSPFATDSAGRIGISDLGGSISIDDNGGSITVDGTVAISGTVAVTQSTSPWVVSNPTLSVVGGGTESTALRVTIANDSTGVLSVDDNGGSLTVDGSVTVNNAAGASAVNIQDGGNSITVDGSVTVTNTGGTLNNGAETAVSAVAVQVLASNAARKKYLIENTGAANVRVGVSGVTATTGFRLIPGGSMIMEMPDCPTQALFAIRETAVDSIVFAQEVV